MKKSNDSGHVKNSAQFNEAVEYVSNIGVNYNPSNIQIQLSTLQTISAEIKVVLDGMAKVEPIYKEAIYNRQNVFNNLDQFTSKALNALSSCDVDYKILSEAKSISKKILGSSKPKKKGEPPPEDLEVIMNAVTETDESGITEEVTNKRTNSTSQRGFDRRSNNFTKFCFLLSSIPEYIPNETELQISELNIFQQKVADTNKLAVKAINLMTDARIARDTLFYTRKNNAYETFKKIKSYVKSIYGASAPQSRAVSKLSFKLIKSQ